MHDIMMKITIFLICFSPAFVGLGVLIGIVGGNINYKKEQKIKNKLMEEFVGIFGLNELSVLLQYCRETGTDMIVLMRSMINSKKIKAEK